MKASLAVLALLVAGCTQLPTIPAWDSGTPEAQVSADAPIDAVVDSVVDAAPLPPIVVLTIGDSITSDATVIAGSYRIALFSLASFAGRSLAFIGRQGVAPAFFHHEGYSGYQCDEQENTVMPWLRAPGSPRPDIVLLLCGTVDASRGQQAQVPVRLPHFVDQLRQTLPTARILAMGPHDQPGLPLDAIRDQLPPLVLAAGGEYVANPLGLVDLYDAYHPASIGQSKLAVAWWRAIGRTP